MEVDFALLDNLAHNLPFIPFEMQGGKGKAAPAAREIERRMSSSPCPFFSISLRFNKCTLFFPFPKKIQVSSHSPGLPVALYVPLSLFLLFPPINSTRSWSVISSKKRRCLSAADLVESSFRRPELTEDGVIEAKRKWVTKRLCRIGRYYGESDPLDLDSHQTQSKVKLTKTWANRQAKHPGFRIISPGAPEESDQVKSSRFNSPQSFGNPTASPLYFRSPVETVLTK